MNSYIKEQLNKDDKLLKHSVIIIIAAFIANGFNYLYQLYMGRSLGAEAYGVLGSLFAMIYIISVINGTLLIVVSRFVTQYKVRRDYGKIKRLLIGVLKRVTIFGGIGFGIFAIFSSMIAGFLKIESGFVVILVAVYGFITLYNPIFNGVLNGLQKFKQSATVNIIATAAKLVFGVLFVYVGLGVQGALYGVIIGVGLGLAVALNACKKIFSTKSKKIDRKGILQYIAPVFLGTVLPMVMINIDIILVKHFFTSVEAGYYTAASMIASIVLFASGSMVNVMFPKVAKCHEKSGDCSKLLKATLFYTSIIAFVAVVIYFTAPTLVVNLLYGPEYQISHLIGLFGVAVALYSINNVFIRFNLARKRKAFIYMVMFALILEIVSILIFHKSLIEIIKIIVVCNAILCGMLLLTVREELGFNNVKMISEDL